MARILAASTFRHCPIFRALAEAERYTPGNRIGRKLRRSRSSKLQVRCPIRLDVKLSSHLPLKAGALSQTKVRELLVPRVPHSKVSLWEMSQQSIGYNHAMLRQHLR